MNREKAAVCFFRWVLESKLFRVLYVMWFLGIISMAVCYRIEDVAYLCLSFLLECLGFPAEEVMAGSGGVVEIRKFRSSVFSCFCVVEKRQL